MRHLIFLLLLALSEARVYDRKKECITVRRQQYEKETLKDNVLNPYQLAIDYNTNTLFYSFTTSPRVEESFKLQYLSLKTGESGDINNIFNGFASAVNRKGSKVYVGGQDGLYTFDYNTKSATKLSTKQDYNIWQMFFKDLLYFTIYPEEKAYLYNNENVLPVPGLEQTRVLVFGVKNDGNYLYSNSSGLFKYDKSTKMSTHLVDKVVNAMTTDILGNIFFSSPDGIYYVNDKRNEIEEIAAIENIFGVAIESDGNIIYAAENSLVRLVPSKDCLDNKI